MTLSRGIRYSAIFILLFLFSCQYITDTEARYALIVIIDGLRPDALDQADTPNLDKLISEGSYTPSAETDSLALTLPSVTSLVTGLTSDRHGMSGNKNRDDLGHTEFETIFTVAKKNGLKTAIFVGKDKLSYINVPGSTDRFESTSMSDVSVQKITHSYLAYMKAHIAGLTLLHFPYPDLAEHRSGWMSPQYVESIESVDKALGTIMESLRKEDLYRNMFIVITSDHGGQGKIHGSDIPNSIKIPWLALGKNVKKDYDIKEQVYIYDTAPTVLHALGIAPPTGIQGRVIQEIFRKN